MEKIIVPLAFGFSPRKGRRRFSKAMETSQTCSMQLAYVPRELFQELEKLTLRKDLHYLTLLTWAEVLYIRGLIWPTRAWCPLCYEEWRISGQIVYDPLIWSLLPVTACISHHIHLSQFCPHEDCHRKLPGLAWRSRPGYCSYCHRWLGNSPGMMQSPSSSLEDDILEWQQWVTQSLGSVIALTPSVVTQPTRNHVIANLRSCIQHVSGGNARTFGQLLGVSILYGYSLAT